MPVELNFIWVVYLSFYYYGLKIEPVRLNFIWDGYIFVNDTGCEWVVVGWNLMGCVELNCYINFARHHPRRMPR
jgi:hypothetical protein